MSDLRESNEIDFFEEHIKLAFTHFKEKTDQIVLAEFPEDKYDYKISLVHRYVNKLEIGHENPQSVREIYFLYQWWTEFRPLRDDNNTGIIREYYRKDDEAMLKRLGSVLGLLNMEVKSIGVFKLENFFTRALRFFKRM